MYRLLIVDDEEEIRNGLAGYFPWSEFGFEVADAVEDGERALRIIRNGTIDVVLADIRMPRLSGIDLARIVAEERLRVRVVFLSAHKDFDYAQKAIEYGVRRYVLKPTEYAEIASVFSELKSELDGDAGKLDSEYASSGEESHRTTRRVALVEIIKEYVVNEYSRATLEGAARVVHLNPQYASRLFKAVSGEHFNEYLTRIKMKKAAELLRDARYRTHQVSEVVGYSSPKNFARSFKRYFGVSPREFRRTC